MFVFSCCFSATKTLIFRRSVINLDSDRAPEIVQADDLFFGGTMNSKKLLLTVVIVLISGGFFDVISQTRIRFARGRTSASVSGTLGGGASRSYVLGARRGQVFSGNISSKNGCVKFTEGATSSSFITEPGDNYVRITNYCRTQTSFIMTVSINFGSD